MANSLPYEKYRFEMFIGNIQIPFKNKVHPDEFSKNKKLHIITINILKIHAIENEKF